MNIIKNFGNSIKGIFSRHRKLAISSTAIFLSLTLLLSGLQIGLIPLGSQAPEHSKVLTVGQNQIVLTIGTAEAATVADYTCDGSADDVQFQTALNALPITGGKIEVLGGSYNFTATVSRAIDDITIEGVGKGTYFAYNGVSAIFSAGSQDCWVFRDFSTDAGGVNIASATNCRLDNIWVSTTYYPSSVRTATYIIAASDAPANWLAQADYVCDGTADNVEIQTAIDALPTRGGIVKLTAGTFTTASPISLTRDYVTLEGEAGDTSTIIQSVSGGTHDLIDIFGDHNDIRNMTLHGQKTVATVGYGIDLASAGNTLLENLFVLNGTGTAIRMRSSGGVSSYGVKVNKVNITGWAGSGILITEGTVDCWIENCEISANNRALEIYNGGYLWVKNNYFEGNLTQSIQITRTDEYTYRGTIWIQDNFFYGSIVLPAPIGIYALVSSTLDLEQLLILDNSFRGFSNYAIQTNTISTGAIKGLKISRNTFESNDRDIIITGAATLYSNGEIKDNYLSNSVTSTITFGTSATSNKFAFQNNTNYIAPGEVRSVSGSLTAGVANAIAFAWHNPEAQDILIKKVAVEVTTGGGIGGSQLDVGISDDAIGTNRGTEFFDDLPLNSVQINDSWVVSDNGTQTKWVSCQDSASATDGWITGQILTQNATSLVGKYYIEYAGR
jgi:hypothetical protein